MESIEKKIENYAVVFNVNLVRATLNEATDFRDYIDEAIYESDKDIIVNLSACEHLDSTFLGVLVSCYKKLKIQNRTLVIIEPVDQSSIFLTLNSIGKIFPLYTNVKVALEDIENKRLLEKEISELGDEKVKKFERAPKANFKSDSHPPVDVPGEHLAKKIDQIDPNLEIGSNHEPHENKDLLIKNVEEDKSVFIVEHDENEMLSESLEKSEPDKLTITGSFSDLNMKESQEVHSTLETQEIITTVRRTNNGSISWEFGFN